MDAESRVPKIWRRSIRPRYAASTWAHWMAGHAMRPNWPDENQVLDGFQLKGLRETFGQLEEELIWIAGRANQLVDWSRNHQFCGQCGHPTEDKSEERAKICPACGLVNYPRLSPAVIMAVVRGDRLLLASNKRFKSGFYSVLAGFVEPGETLEECVAREIKEEVGISVKNIRYFGSQPWPFPNSLMVGFLADYAGGEIKADPVRNCRCRLVYGR